MKREVKIGIYAVVIMLCAWAGIRFLSGVDVFGRNATYYARYEQVNGVQNAAPVMIRGVKVGKVSEIRVSPENPTDVEVVISMSKAYRIPEDSEARIFSTSLMGSKAIEIALGKSDRMLENGATISSGYTKDLMSGDGSELDELKEKIVALVDNFNSALSGLSMLVDNNNRNITEAIDHLNSIMANLDNVMGSDSQQLADIVDGINSFTTTLRDNNARIDSIIMNVNDVTGELADRNVSASLAQAVEAIPEPSVSEEDIGALMALAPDNAALAALVANYQAAQTVKAVWAQASAAFEAVQDNLPTLAEGVNSAAASLRQTAQQISAAMSATGGQIDLSGLLQLTSGLSQLAQSYSAFHEGLVSYAGGVDALSANWSSVYSGISSLASGAGELSDGVAALNEETSKIPELIDELTGGSAEDESADGSAQASFLDERNEDTASVQFVIMTEGISEPEAEAEPAPAEEEQGFFAELWDRIVALFT